MCGDDMAKKQTKTDWMNRITSFALFNHYKNICLNMFEWKNLPEGLEERFIERVLFNEGKVLFFRDPKQSFMALPCFGGTQLDFYGEPLYWRTNGLGYNKQYHRDDCVLIENNKLRTPTVDMVALYVSKMYEVSRTMDTNIATSKMPWIILCDDRQLLTYKSIIQKIDENEPAIFGVKGLTMDEIQVLQTKAQFIGNELMDFHHSVENTLLTYLGINNCPVDKKERLITGEAESNDQQLEVNATVMLEARQRAVEKINKLYGLKISVDLRHKPKEVDPDVSETGSEQTDEGNA